MKVYLDNAASTALDPEVQAAMVEVMQLKYGNPSSIHTYGREARTIIETARKSIAKILNVSTSEIFFTSGGTEANNHAINAAVQDMGVTNVITTPIEHHAVLNPLHKFEQQKKIKIQYVKLDHLGRIDFDHLETLLTNNQKSFVTLMHGNNEIGNLLPIKEVAQLCEKHQAIFHSDMVQTIGHYQIDLQKYNIHFATCSAHKFHGPKGIGFLYINNQNKVNPLIYGGTQERNMRGGTENTYAISGMAKALEIATGDIPKTMAHIQHLKNYMIQQLESSFPLIEYNGDAKGSSLYTVLNVRFPFKYSSEMLLFNLDIAGIAVSGGSACTSGTSQGSHVIEALNTQPDYPSIRFSFSKHTTFEEIDYCISQLNKILTIT